MFHQFTKSNIIYRSSDPIWVGTHELKVQDTWRMKLGKIKWFLKYAFFFSGTLIFDQKAPKLLGFQSRKWGLFLPKAPELTIRTYWEKCLSEFDKFSKISRASLLDRLLKPFSSKCFAIFRLISIGIPFPLPIVSLCKKNQKFGSCAFSVRHKNESYRMWSHWVKNYES